VYLLRDRLQKTNPVDAAFLNDQHDPRDVTRHYGRPTRAIRRTSLPGRSRCVSFSISPAKTFILATVIAYEVEMRLCEFGVPGIREYGWHHATLTAFAAPIAAGRVLNLTVGQMVQAIGISAARTFSPGAVTAGKLDQHEEHRRSVATRMGVESALLAKARLQRPRAHDRWQGRADAVFGHVDYKGTKGAIRDVDARGTVCPSRPAITSRSSIAA